MYIPAQMADNVETLRAQFMRKEKFIKDVIRNDARSSYQFVSAVRKELEKEKNVMAAKLYFLYKTAQAFTPGSSAEPGDEFVGMHGHLQKIVDDQTKFVAGRMDQAEQETKPRDKPAAPTAAMIPDIIKQYIQTKDMLRQKIKTFVATRRAGVVKGRLDETVRQMKSNGGVEKFAGKEPVEDFLKRQETAIIVEIVMDEMADKTASLDKVVNRLVDWRARAAKIQPNSGEADILDQEMHALVRELVGEIAGLKDRENLVGETESGILNHPEGRAELAKLKTNINEQKFSVSIILDALTAAKRKSADGKPALRDEEVQANKELALNACDKIESLVKDERNVYLNFRKWESPPGKFLEEISLAVQFTS